jgi:hypothetical protein
MTQMMRLLNICKTISTKSPYETIKSEPRYENGRNRLSSVCSFGISEKSDVSEVFSGTKKREGDLWIIKNVKTTHI